MRFFWIILAAWIGATVPCIADDSAADARGTFTLVLENDLFGGGTDQHYTHGTRAAWLSPEGDVPTKVAEWANLMPLFAEGGRKRVSYSLGQNIYTPTDIRPATLLVNDRPYAGWLYGGIGLISDTGRRLDNLQLELGMVGPAALAGETQAFVHGLIDSPDPKGWGNQLHNEPGLVLTYERQWRKWHEFNFMGLEVDATPRAGGSLGNVYTHLEAGVTLRLGNDLPSDYGPPRIRPSLPGSDFFHPTEGLGWYVFAGLGGRLVGHNIFLDGNTFGHSHSVNKERLVGDLQGGLALTWGRARIAYTHIIRSAEYVGQGAIDRFGALSVSVRF
ncbi:lipid A deacylase LpxR family protein [Magnetospira thiophila]